MRRLAPSSKEGASLQKTLDFEGSATQEGPMPLDTLVAAETLARPLSAAPVAEPAGDPESIGRYEVRGVLGEGSMGRVYRAYDEAGGSGSGGEGAEGVFASDPRVVERFRREAAAGRWLGHPALVDLLDAGPDYLVQELVEGESLAARLRRRGKVRPQAALPILAAVAEALDHVHSRAVVHRDVKPSNVLLARGGAAKLADFGIARLGWAPMTRTGEVIGTPAYMAPEQLSGGVVHAQSDLYSLAVVAHETLTGVRPFRRSSLGALLQSIVADEPPRASAVNPALPAAVDLVLAKALAKAPKKRYPDGRAFVTALRGAFDRAGSRAPDGVVGASDRDLPAGPVGPAKVLVRLGRVRRLHGRAVPPEELARAESHVAEQDQLGEARAVAEVAGGWLAALAGLEPVGVVALDPREGLRGADVLAVPLERQEAGHPGPARAGDEPALSDEQDAVVVLAEHLLRVVGVDPGRRRRPQAPVVPVDGQRPPLLPGGETPVDEHAPHADLGVEPDRRRLHRLGSVEAERIEGGVEVVDRHVGQRPAAEGPEAAPIARGVGGVVGTRGCEGRARGPSSVPGAPRACPRAARSCLGAPIVPLQAWTSRTAPMAPSQIHSAVSR